MPLSRVEYYDYIANSPVWQEKRRAALRRADYRCQVCNATNVQLDVHHRTYARLGEERDDDLTVLCHDCHTLFSREGKLAPAIEESIPPSNAALATGMATRPPVSARPAPPREPEVEQWLPPVGLMIVLIVMLLTALVLYAVYVRR